jgi:hypothetical protein
MTINQRVSLTFAYLNFLLFHEKLYNLYKFNNI